MDRLHMYGILRWIMIWLFFHDCCNGSSHRDLRDYLLRDYGAVYIRPVKKASTTTNVTFRPLFINLITMDTKNQQLTMYAFVKTVWKDEFLTWNTSDFEGTDTIFFPSTAIWTPDITLKETFIENGVWDLVDVAAKKISTNYTCCKYLYYNLEYRLVFQRQASFYVTYLILPVILLSTLAVAVFFLPPKCGSKLQFSITNLLALSFFQKLVAELIPPSGRDAPIIDFYFQGMIIMVSTSVLATVVVISVSTKTDEPVPEWLKWLVLEKISHAVCFHADVNRLKNSSKSNEINEDKAKLSNIEESQRNGFSYSVNEKDVVRRNHQTTFSDQWTLIGTVISRCFAFVFGVVLVITTSVILVYVWTNSNTEFELAVGEHKDKWQSQTYYNFY